MNSARFLVLAICLASFAASTPDRASAVGTASLTTNNGAPVAFVGLPFSVHVNVANLDGMDAWQTQVGFDPTLFELAPPPAFDMTFLVNRSCVWSWSPLYEGLLQYAAACYTLPGPEPLTGSGRLVTLPLIPLAPTPYGIGTPVDIRHPAFYTITGETHPVTETDGSVKIIPCPVLDSNRAIGFGEFLALLASWNSVGPPNQSANWNVVVDFDQNNVVGFGDSLALLAYWNDICPA